MKYGGSIHITSQRDEGTAMIIDLPALDGTSDQPARKEPTPTPQPGTETVLVVDDEPMIRDLVARMLRSAGYTVHTAEHGKAAIAFLQAQTTPASQFVVTDVVMPEIDGRRLGGWLTIEHPTIGVLYSLNQAHDDGEPLAPLLPKPFTPQALLTAVRDGFSACDRWSSTPCTPLRAACVKPRLSRSKIRGRVDVHERFSIVRRVVW